MISPIKPRERFRASSEQRRIKLWVEKGLGPHSVPRAPMMHAALRTPGSLAPTSRVGGVARPARRRFAHVQPRAAANDAPSRVWHCPPPEKERTASQAASVLSKLPPHVLETGGLEPSTQSPQNQQAYLGSLAERFLPVDLSVRGLRVLNVDPPVFAIPDFVSGAEADALAKLAKGGTKLVRNAKTVDLSAKLPAPMGENMPALAQRLGELVEDAKKFVRCDGAWLEGSDLTRWAPVGGFTAPPPPGAFAFEMPALCHTAKSKTTDDLPDAFEREAANEKRYQRRALVRVFLTDPPAEAEAEAEGDSVSKPEMDREAFGAKFVICDVAIAPRKGTAIVTFPSFADGMPDERTAVVMRADVEAPAAWLDLPVAVGLEEGGIRKPVTMADVTVEKVGEEASVGEAARDKNRQEWRANINGGGAGADVSEDVKKKLEELKESGL
jgi:hypothetical protein